MYESSPIKCICVHVCVYCHALIGAIVCITHYKELHTCIII